MWEKGRFCSLALLCARAGHSAAPPPTPHPTPTPPHPTPPTPPPTHPLTAPARWCGVAGFAHEPPKATTGARAVCRARSAAMMLTQSAMACAVVQYARQRWLCGPHSAGWESGSYRCSAKTSSAPGRWEGGGAGVTAGVGAGVQVRSRVGAKRSNPPSLSPISHMSPVLLTYSSTGDSLPV